MKNHPPAAGAHVWLKASPSSAWEIVRVSADAKTVTAIGCFDALPIKPSWQWGPALTPPAQSDAPSKIPPACCPQSLKEAAPNSVFLCTHHHRGEEHKEPFLVSIARVTSTDSKCIRVEWLSNTEPPANFSPMHGKEIRITRDVPRVIRQLHPIHEFNWDALSEYQRDCILKANAHQQGGLADCPFCGATEAALDKGNRKGVYGYMDAPSGDHARTLHVVCLECGSGAPSAEAWNRRLSTGKARNA